MHVLSFKVYSEFTLERGAPHKTPLPHARNSGSATDIRMVQDSIVHQEAYPSSYSQAGQDKKLYERTNVVKRDAKFVQINFIIT